MYKSYTTASAVHNRPIAQLDSAWCGQSPKFELPSFVYASSGLWACIFHTHGLFVTITEAICFITYEISLRTSSHEFKFNTKSNVECAENVQSSHTIECECELCHISNFYSCIAVKNSDMFPCIL